MSTWKAVATWVPRGAFIKNCKPRTLYRGEDEGKARAALDVERSLVRGLQKGEGVTLLDLYRDGRYVVKSSEYPLAEPRPPGGVNAIGYPAHNCGSPMMPSLGPGRLYCTGCGAHVSATAEQREKASRAARAEMQP